MGNLLSPTHLIIILLIVLVLFGRGKISDFMGDFAKGIKSFKKGLKEDDDDFDVPAEKNATAAMSRSDAPRIIDSINEHVEVMPVNTKATTVKRSRPSTAAEAVNRSSTVTKRATTVKKSVTKKPAATTKKPATAAKKSATTKPKSAKSTKLN